nr:unnamed protein product [Digitaria exilis]
MAVASTALPLLLARRPVSPRPALAHLHSPRLALAPLRPATLSAAAATRPRMAGRLQQLNAASCCGNSAPAAGTTGGSAKDH